MIQELWDLYWCPMRLSYRQKVKLALLLGYLAQKSVDDRLMPRVETLQNDILFEEPDDPDETDAAQIAELVAACKELQSKVTECFGAPKGVTV